jgi:xanthine dehydrogenase accessory factor
MDGIDSAVDPPTRVLVRGIVATTCASLVAFLCYQCGMKELRDILALWRTSSAGREAAWLATVVRVSGSAYRQPGARLLLGKDGPQHGSVSGGCLEGDLWERVQKKPETPWLMRYDLRNELDLIWGSGMGCEGVVEILVEPLPTDEPAWIGFVESCWRERRKGGLVTLLADAEPLGLRLGARLCVDAEGAALDAGERIELVTALNSHVREAIAVGLAFERRVLVGGSELALLIEPILPPPALWIVGAADDARPLVLLAKTLGWRVGLCDHRPALARAERFPEADEVRAGQPAEIVPELRLDDRSAVVLMSHDYARDTHALRALWPTPAFYIGLMGARTRGTRLLHESGHTLDEARARGVFTPVGLDVGAESPETVALSVLAEIQAVLARRHGGSLRDESGPIHRVPASAATDAPQRA